MKFLETQSRTIAKLVSWRVFVTISHFITALAVTGSVKLSMEIASWSILINSVLYWLHERSWNWMQWNRRAETGLLFYEGLPRTGSKLITWRIVISASNFLIAFLVSGNWKTGAFYLGTGAIVNMIMYVLHERAWNRCSWGKESV